MESLLPNGTAKAERSFLSPGRWALLSFFIMVFVMGLVKIYSPDLGFHLISAEWIINNKRFIHIDTFNYGAGGSRYYDMQWLFQLFTYSLYKAGGDAALIITNVFLITVSFLLVWYRFVKNAEIEKSLLKPALFAFIALILVQPLTFEIRPHVFSWIFLNLVLIFLESYRKGNQKTLFLLPAIMLIWANTHSLSI